MSWDKAQRRWTKMYRGERFVVSCKTLGAAPNKPDSWSAANLWWKSKLREMQIAKMDHAALLDAVERGEHARRLLLMNDAANLDISDHNQTLAHLMVSGLPTTNEGRETAFAAAKEKLELKPKDCTLGTTQYSHLQVRSASGAACAKRGNQHGARVKAFVLFLGGEQTSPSVITAERWKAYYLHLAANDLSNATKKMYLGSARMFVESMVEDGILEPPSNLYSKAMRFSVDAVKVKTLTLEQMKADLAKTTGQNRLFLLLMLNCGMQPQDLVDLIPDDVDFDAGTITRKRSKTAKHANVPTVTYKLWPETLMLLKEWRKEGDRLLGIGVRIFEKRFKNLGIHSPRWYRKSPASHLDKHPVHRTWSQHYLGHSPRSVAEKHYLDHDGNALFFAATDWLGAELGIV